MLIYSIIFINNRHAYLLLVNCLFYVNMDNTCLLTYSMYNMYKAICFYQSIQYRAFQSMFLLSKADVCFKADLQRYAIIAFFAYDFRLFSRLHVVQRGVCYQSIAAWWQYQPICCLVCTACADSSIYYTYAADYTSTCVIYDSETDIDMLYSRKQLLYMYLYISNIVLFAV